MIDETTIATMPDGEAEHTTPEPMIVRAQDQEQAPEPEHEFIKRWQARIKAGRKFHKNAFARMKKNRQLVRHGCDKDWQTSGKYRANITLRHVTRKAADLYARNPRAHAKRRQRLEYQVWDENPQSIQEAMMAIQAAPIDPMTGQPMPDPNALALMQEIQEVKQRTLMLDRVGQTLQALFHHSLDAQDPHFKVQAKGAVRRTIIDGAGYVKLDFFREFVSQKGPLLRDNAPFPAHLEGNIRSDADRKTEDHEEAAGFDAELAAQAYQETAPAVVDREGLLYTFPSADEIIVDPQCRCLRSFEGANWIVYEALRTPEQVRQIYGVDLGKNFTAYYGDADRPGAKRVNADVDPESTKSDGAALIWEVQDKHTGHVFTLADGYDHFLERPRLPMILLDKFFTVIPLLFNDIEVDDELFPPADVELLEESQHEYNRARHGVREHRQAARPRYVAPAGKFEDKDKEMVANCPPHSLIEMKGLTPGENIGNVVQAFPVAGIDPNLYETSTVLDDTLRTTGSQEANLGGTSGHTATETQIAEGSRVASIQSNVDDLDDWLSELAECAGAALLQNMSIETVKKVVGPGAVWPDFTAGDIGQEIFLEIKAGSAGRPNKAAELANLERVAPILLQTPGIDPAWFAHEIIKRLDDGLDPNEAVLAGVPSMVALNAAMGRGAGGGPGAEDGGDQTGNGTDGATNAPDPQTNEPQPQGEFPA